MYNNKLKFNKDGKFTIMMATDIHEKTDVKSPVAKKKFADTMLLINTALDEIKPDLVVLGGDIFTNREDSEPFSDYRFALERISKPFIDRQIPFAVVLGNHDHDGNCIDKQVEMFNELDYCIIDNADENITGNANYNRLIYSSSSDKPVFNLWFMDSNNVCEDKTVSKYDWVHRDQIEWYEKTANELRKQNEGKPIPAICFQHIPVVEEYQLLRKAKLWELPFSVRGHGFWNKNFYVLKEGVKGNLGEGPCTPDFDGGQFKSWKKTGDVIGAFFGHDHMNDFCGNVDGIVLGQCKTCSFRVFTDGCRCGVRSIILKEKDPTSFETQMHHFKDFGLVSTSLGPLKKRLTDRQSVALTIARNALIAGGAIAGTVAVANVVSKKIKKKYA